MNGRRRAAESYARRGPVRGPYDRVLIKCEGEKTEPRYFGGLRLHYRLSSANIEITPAHGTDPMSIVSFAETRLGNYDRAYCVFDRDGHQNYDAAVGHVARSAERHAGKLVEITSWPCFEFWLLLHFGYSAAPFHRAGKKSSGDQALSKLATHVPGYNKGLKNIYDLVAPKTPDAIQNAIRLQRENTRTRSTNLSTRVHELVQYLIALKVNK
jgi:RloB-like protein